MKNEGARSGMRMVVVAAVALASTGAADARRGAIELLDHTTAIDYQRDHPDAGLAAWKRRVPQVDLIRIRSSADGKRQRALWYDSGSTQQKPLLVVLHSWGADYDQNLDIPFAEFAIKNDWVFVHPDFRGPNLRPEATASELAVQDVLDAVNHAREQAAVDGSRIYLVGYSGGGMKALVLAGRHPERWAGVVAWGAIYDIADWYHHRGKEPHYRRQIAASCGGAPRPGTRAEAECRERSPLSYLENAAGRVPVLIAHGLRDTTVPPGHAMSAFDALADEDDRFTEEQHAFVDRHGQLPPDLVKPGGAIAPLFERAGTPVRLHRTSRAATLVLYEGGHDMVYNSTLRWLSEQRRR